MRTLALKIDVDTLRGTLEGVPRLIDALREMGAGASFLFSLGPDHTGWALKRVFRRGFLSKVSRTSVLEHYGARTLMYGVLLPSPDIGRRAAEPMRAARSAGFECGIHAWDHVRWHDGVRAADERWTRVQWERAIGRFTEVFGEPARVSGAAGWQINAATVRLQAASGIDYASDGRGPRPYRIAIGEAVPGAPSGTSPGAAPGGLLGPPQYPTTLPTLDELLGVDGLDQRNVHERLLRLTGEADPSLPQVFTLHAELEGQKLLPVLRRLLEGWRRQGWTLTDLAGVHRAWGDRPYPTQHLRWGTVPGRAGELVISD